MNHLYGQLHNLWYKMKIWDPIFKKKEKSTVTSYLNIKHFPSFCGPACTCHGVFACSLMTFLLRHGLLPLSGISASSGPTAPIPSRHVAPKGVQSPYRLCYCLITSIEDQVSLKSCHFTRDESLQALFTSLQCSWLFCISPATCNSGHCEERKSLQNLPL